MGPSATTAPAVHGLRSSVPRVCVSCPCRPARCAVRTAVREVAQPIAYLASPQAASITGADFLIDGGLVKTAW